MTELAALVSGAVLLGRRGSYRTDGELRRGGMGTIVLAYSVHDDEQRPLVVKVSLGDDEHARGRVQQEIAALAALHHPRIVRVLDEGNIDGHLWYAMDYVGPCNLGDILLVRSNQAPIDLPSLIIGIIEAQLPVVERRQRVGLPIATAVSLLIDVAKTVAHAHAQGVIHRDLKPANILLSDSGEPVLCDFGVARGQGFNLHLTAMDEVVGTFDYLAPELLQGYDADEASDCFAIGAMLYECISGQLPPRRQRSWQPLPHLRGVPKPLAAIIRHALHPDPRQRQRSAMALAQDLRRFQRGLAVRAPQPWWWQRLLAAMYRRPMLSGFVLSLLLVVVSSTWLVHLHREHQRFAWQQPLVNMQPSTMDVGRFASRDDQWSYRSDGGGGIVAGYGAAGSHGTQHVTLAMPVPARMGHRVAVEVDTGNADQEVSIFLSSQANPMLSGYVVQLGAYDNSAMILRRGSQLLWMGEYRLQPDQRIQLALERRGDVVRVTKNGAQIVRLRDVLPLAVSYAGITTYLYEDRVYQNPPQYRSFSLAAIDVPPRVGIDWLVTSYAMASDGTLPQERAAIAERGIAFAEAVAQGLSADDDRQAVLSLRRERLMAFVEDPVYQDISHHGERLSALAEYHLHRLQQLSSGHHTQALHLIRQAHQALVPDEFARLMLAIEQRIPQEDFLSIFSGLTSLIEPQPLLHDFLSYRALVRLSSTEMYTDRFWNSVRALTAHNRDNFWTRQAVRFQAQYEQWQAYRKRPLLEEGHPLAGGAYIIEQWETLLAGGNWPQPDAMRRQGSEEFVTYTSATVDSIRQLPVPEDYPFLVDVYTDAAWSHSPWQVILRMGPSMEQQVYEQALRHLAVMLLTMPDPEQVLNLLPGFTGQIANGGALELAIAAIIRGAWEPQVVFPESDPPEGSYAELIVWLRQPHGSQPEVTVEMASSLGPMLWLALARQLYQAGDDEAATRILQQLAEEVPALPAGQMAHALLEWGWPS
ncbi:MAG: serine/threonine protein kinase [Planctomycetota bacterium]|nr:MAG: serine/threonine protein kinase [Planctomycetota bacterium]